MATKADPRVRSVWMVSREYDGLAGAGGVKDVCRQLAESLAGGGCAVSVVLPRYGFMNPRALGFKPLRLPDACSAGRTGAGADPFDIDMNYAGENRRETVSAWCSTRKGVRVYLVEAERFAEKLGVYTYTEGEEKLRAWQRQGTGHYDYFAMNIVLQKAALALMISLDERPDVIHCQDGHTAVLPAMIREVEGYRQYFRRTGCVVTIHNAGAGYHQEVADLHFARAVTALPEQVISSSLLDRCFDPFIAASGYAELNTVSEQYARELQETSDDERTGWLGHHLLQRGIILAGITNGINPTDFDATKGKKLGLAAGFDPCRGRFGGKRICKESLLRSLQSRRKRANLTQYGRLAMLPEQPLLTFIGRLTAQKGVDLLIDCANRLLAEDPGFQLVVLGGGDPSLEQQLSTMAEDEANAGRVCFLRGYDQVQALKVYAAGDFFLIPSRYEPCGLTDYIAQLFGNLPIVHHVGGLVKVLDGETGFAYQGHTAGELAGAVCRGLAMYRNDPAALGKMQQNGCRRVREQHAWDMVRKQYLALYRQAIARACDEKAGRGET